MSAARHSTSNDLQLLVHVVSGQYQVHFRDVQYADAAHTGDDEPADHGDRQVLWGGVDGQVHDGEGNGASEGADVGGWMNIRTYTEKETLVTV